MVCKQENYTINSKGNHNFLMTSNGKSAIFQVKFRFPKRKDFTENEREPRWGFPLKNGLLARGNVKDHGEKKHRQQVKRFAFDFSPKQPTKHQEASDIHKQLEEKFLVGDQV